VWRGGVRRSYTVPSTASRRRDVGCGPRFRCTEFRPAQLALSFTTNEIGYTGSNATGFTPYIGVFTTQLSGNLAAFGCVVAGVQTCTDTIANTLIFEATAAQTIAAGLGAVGQSGTIKSTWSATESPASPTTPTPEPISLVLFGSGLVGVASLYSRGLRRS
jgi:hypothetical protein